MGPKTSAELKNEQVREKIKIEIEDIYCMFDQTIEAVRTSKFMESTLNRQNPSYSNPVKNSKISNLQAVLDQLLESFKLKEGYIWGKDIFKMFKKHFRHRFQQMWPINKEEFYKLVLSHCDFETLDLKKELSEIAQSLEIYDLANAKRMSYERYFYEVGAARIQEKLPSSFVGQLPWEQDLKQADVQQTQFNMAAINETIIKHENDFMVDKSEQDEFQHKNEQIKEVDFLPLFINSNSEKKHRISQSPMMSQSKKNDLIKQTRVQNATIIAPEIVFFQRLTQDNKAEISDLVKFYRQFSNALQQMFFSSTSMVSAPYKHFVYCLQEKMKRKNIKNKDSSNLMSSASKTKYNKLIFSQKYEGRKYRQMREFNNNLLLTQIKQFAQAYTDFVWMFLELNQIGQSKLGKLLNIYTVYGIVVKSIWKFVEWISDRGCEYQQFKIQEYYRYRSMPNNSKIDIENKKALLTVLRTLVGQKNPQKYLKKIVIFYRQANKLSACADDLIGLFQELLIWLIKQGLAKDIALFRMPIIIQTLLKFDQALTNAGEISYSWTTWCIVIEIFKGKIGCGNMPQLPQLQLQRIYTEPDYQQINLDQ